MKEMKYITMALLCVLLASCMGKDYAEPVIEESPYGNNTLTETNVITIAELKDMYKTVISGSTMKQITDDIQIKGTITGNDIGGNIYQEVALEDETGALLVCISQAGLYGPLPVGQQILVSLKDLYIGGYGQQAEIGGVYTNTNTGKQSVGRMDRYTWNEHYKILGMGETPEPEVFDVSKISDATYLYENCGKLMTIKGVVLKDADGEKVYAPDDGSASITANCVNRAFSGLSSSRIVLRTSTYADFANAAMMTGTVDITGIFTRYNNIWQILMRDENDIQAGATALLKEPFDDDQGEFTIVNKTLPDELSFVWKWTSANYGMKGSAYYNSTNYAAESWLISPSVDIERRLFRHADVRTGRQLRFHRQSRHLRFHLLQ